MTAVNRFGFHVRLKSREVLFFRPGFILRLSGVCGSYDEAISREPRNDPEFAAGYPEASSQSPRGKVTASRPSCYPFLVHLVHLSESFNNRLADVGD